MNTDSGMDCYGDDREALADYERFFNSKQCSDITLLVDELRFRTHKIVLARSSDVFERMISKEWCGDGMIEIELIEDRECVEVFGIFLRFLYCNHIKLRAEDSLAVLTLADKYNVVSLRKVCLNFVISRIIPQLTLKEVFHVWFQYGTKCFHQALVKTCVDRLATQFQDIISGQEWEKEWLLLDKDQMNEFLRTSELTVASEYEIWLAVFRWIQNLIQSEKRTSVSVERILGAVLPNIRFPMMTADELNQVEKLPFVEQHAKYFQPYLMMSYKYRALPLISRAASREFCGSQFLLRNYTRLRWDKRFVIADFSSLPRYSEISFKANTCGSTLPPQPWDWELKLHPKGVSGNCDEFKCVLVSSVMLDQSRAVEYMLSIVNDKMILRSIVGKKIFSKSRYGSDLELEKRVAVDEVLMENSPLLINDTMVLQLTLRPIE
ncbi:BTB/POZ domain-containing protein 17 [Trichinella nelsoni]|uniref:BTB/POZ domain-containing protein 17 n=1 Tax=Trichinella nelsoni TaxID=6336 RepID=A0A0V0RRK2_9BILA|nr:BTB/POZ domain-containing protein 17 [Trichinella nelsoni]